MVQMQILIWNTDFYVAHSSLFNYMYSTKKFQEFENIVVKCILKFQKEEFEN